MPERIPTGRTDSLSITCDATPDDAYAAVADPIALMKWLPPETMTGRALEYDFREGGRYRIELTYEDASHAIGKTTENSDISAGRFLRIEPGKRIVQAGEFESSDETMRGEVTLTWSFAPTASGTKVTFTAENVPPGISRADHEAGIRASLENLARYVARSR